MSTHKTRIGKYYKELIGNLENKIKIQSYSQKNQGRKISELEAKSKEFIPRCRTVIET